MCFITNQVYNKDKSQYRFAYNMSQWRLIQHQPRHGASNMAIDEAILYTVSHEQQLPTVRLYAWQPFCLSLGYGQRVRDADATRLQKNGWDIVRRPTGGKAILHGDELTYSVALPIQHPLAQGDVVSSYRRISDALLCALQQLGLSPQSEQQAKGNRDLGAVCFEVPSHYEITVDGRKLIGSAQVRRKDGILQHGTLPLWGDIARICEALYYVDETERENAKQHVRDRATTLESVLGIALTYDQVAQAFADGFAQTFNITWAHGDLSQAEQHMAHDLQHTHYDNPDWTYKR
jgi:lipoyl(octanoyl) transferase